MEEAGDPGPSCALEDRRHREEHRVESERDDLFAEIGRLRMQLEWLKKKSGITPVGSG